MKEEELVTLLKVSQELAATLDLKSVLQTTTDRVTELSELKSAAVYLLDGETLRLWAATPPLPPQFPEELRNAPLVHHPHIRAAITTGMPVFIPESTSTALTSAEQAVTEMRHLSSILYLPLLAGTKVMGTLIVATVAEPRALSEAQIDLCRTLANMAALAVENARLYESCQRYAAELEQRIAVCKQTEQVLRESEERWQSALDGAGDGVWDANLQTGETHYSKRWKEILGFAENEIANTNDEWAQRVHPEDMPRVMADLQAHLDGKKASAATEFRMLCKDGSWKWILGRGMVVSRDADGKPLRIVGTHADITARKRDELAANALIRRNQILMQSTHEGIHILDEQGRVIEANDAFCRHLGYTQSEISQLSVFDWDAKLTPAELRANIKKFLDGHAEIETIHRRKDGTLVDVEVSLVGVELDGRKCLYTSSRVITERKKQADELKKTKERYDYATSVGKVGTWDWNPVTGELIWNDEAFRTMGLTPGAVSPSYELFLELVHQDDRELLNSAVQQALHEDKPYRLDFRIVSRDGVERSYHAIGKVEFDESNKPIRMLGTFQDITERKKMENAVSQENNFRKELINSLPGIFYMLDSSGNFLMWNRNLENVLRCNSEEISHSNPLEFFEGSDYILIEESFRKVFAVGETSVEAVLVAKDGTKTPYYFSGQRIDRNGNPVLIGLGIDITERKQAEEHIQQLAHFDSLTGLPNRTLLTDRVSQAISMAQRSHDKLAVLFVDLDHFKNINDTLGHRIGDELLIEIAKRLKSVVRDEDTVSRLGGDEFILLFPGTDTNGTAHVARKLLQAVSQHYVIEQHELVITPSIGIAMYPVDGEDFDALSKCADIAMYRAKRDGRNNYRFFTPEMQARSARNLQLENALRRALERDQLQLHYQPQVSLQDGRIIGAEALLRWQHPELGTVSPAEFIPVAEDSGLILPIGEWVLRTAIRQLKVWIDSGMAPMIIAVNLSAVQFRQPKLLKLVMQILKEEGLPPQYLELELTEGVTMNDPVTAVKVMDDLHERGIRMSIDDFGTGYSSLSQLKRFQVYKLKIDKSFVRDIVEDQEDKAIVKAIINVAMGLGMRTIAEGVETQEQWEFLQENGCDEIQGFHYSRPITADQFETFVREVGQ